MFLHIEPSDSLAIYDQVVRQIKFAVASGAVRVGEFVPSVRELAKDAAINPNTVSRAYRQLQDEGVLQTVRGTGLAVAKGAAQRCRKQRLELIGQRIRAALVEGRQSQLEDAELRELVERQLTDVLRRRS
jgi:GntR family transcriptional regulator